VAFSSTKTIMVKYLTLTPGSYKYHAKNTAVSNYYYTTILAKTPSTVWKKIPAFYDGPIDLYPGSTKSLYIYDHNGSLVYDNGVALEQTKSVDKSRCFHKWKEYVGFTEAYSYCELCDEKREKI